MFAYAIKQDIHDLTFSTEPEFKPYNSGKSDKSAKNSSKSNKSGKGSSKGSKRSYYFKQGEQISASLAEIFESANSADRMRSSLYGIVLAMASVTIIWIGQVW